MGDLLVDDLRDRVHAGRMVVVVGSGVAAAATGGHELSSWSGLIASGIDRVEALGAPAGRVAAARSLLEEGDGESLIMAAEIVTVGLGGREGGEYARWLRETIGSLAVVDPSVPEAVVELGVPVTTTNYDELIERVSGWERATWLDGAAMQRALHGEERAVVHLHGHWRVPKSVILGVRSYQELAGSGLAQGLERAMAAMSSLLFVGVGEGAADPNFGALRKWLAATFAGGEYRHFRLCLNSEVDELRHEHPAEERILPVGYGDEHSALAGFLRGLRPDQARGAHVSAKPGAAAGLAGLPGRPVTVGRGDLIREVAAHLVATPPPAILAQGAPGIGKTNLTLAALHHPDVAERFGKRRWFVRCEAVSSATALAAALASALGVAGSDPLAAAVGELSSGPGVVAFDNLETPWEADTLAVEELLARVVALEQVALIVSVRGAERPAGVRWTRALQLEPLDALSAREVFVSIAPDGFDVPGLSELLEEMGGVPLAVELLAHAAEGEGSLEQLAGRWRAERSRLLQRGAADHRLLSIAVSIDTSWNSAALGDAARKLLSLLGWLPDGIAHEDLDRLLPGTASAAANQARRKGLAFDERDRLRVLPPVRYHLGDAHAPGDDARQRATEHYLALADTLGARVGYEGGGAAIARLAQEVANITTAVHHALAADTPPANAIDAASNFLTAARFSGLDASAIADALLEHAQRSGDPRVLARAHHQIGDIAFARSDHGAARAAYERAQPLYQQIGHVLGQANCIKSLGNIALARSDHDAARAAYEQAQPLYEQIGDMIGQANCIASLGDIALRRSDHATARTAFEQAEPLYRQVGSVLGQAVCIARLGEIALARSDHNTARAAYEQAQPLFVQVGDVLGQANCIKSLGDIALARSDHATARTAYEQAQRLYQQVGDVVGQANCITSLGDIALERSDYDTARAAYAQAQPLFAQVGAVLGQANCITRLGDIALARSDHDMARAAYDLAQTLYQQVGSVLGQANCIKSLGDIALERSDQEAARVAYEQAEPLYHQIGDVLGEANCIARLGDIALARSDQDAARAAYEQALTLFQQLREPYSIGMTLRRLARLESDASVRQKLVTEARAEWLSIKRLDLVDALDDEFADES